MTNVSLEKTKDLNLDWINETGVNYGDGTCKDLVNRTLNRQLLEHWKEIAKKYEIPYFIMGGSLIGSARNGDHIPYEPDVDVMMDGKFNEVLANISVERKNVANDEKFRIVIQKDYRKDVHNRVDRMRYNCKGEVGPKNLYLFKFS